VNLRESLQTGLNKDLHAIVSFPSCLEPTWAERWPITFHCIANFVQVNFRDEVIFHYVLLVQLSNAFLLLYCRFITCCVACCSAQFRSHDCTCVQVSIIGKFRGRKTNSWRTFVRFSGEHRTTCVDQLFILVAEGVKGIVLFQTTDQWNLGKSNEKAKPCQSELKSGTLFSRKLNCVLL